MKLVYFIYVPVVLILTLVIFFAVISAERSITNALWQETFASFRETIFKNAPLILNEEFLSRPSDDLARKNFQEFFNRVQNPATVRLTIWNKDMVVIFSDLKKIIGYHSPDHPDLQRIFSEKSPFFILKTKDVNKPTQSNVGEFLDIYAPLAISGEIVGAVEVQAVSKAILQPVNRGLKLLTYILFSTAIILIASIVLITFLAIVVPTKLLEKSKTEFVAITAHELRTPLAIISGSAERLLELISRKKIDSDIHEMATNIGQESDRLLGIVKDFLDITALEEKRVIFKKEKVDLASLIQEVIAKFREKAREKELYLRFMQPPSLPLAFANRERTMQVLECFIENAIQYTEKGGATITLERMGSFLKTTITDTGIGILPEKQGSLFQKFQTVGERFIHSKEYGSGMGLYIARLLVEKMGGVVRLEKSEIGRGSAFSFTLTIAS